MTTPQLQAVEEAQVAQLCLALHLVQFNAFKALLPCTDSFAVSFQSFEPNPTHTQLPIEVLIHALRYG
jgi:hypothetical protein